MLRTILFSLFVFFLIHNLNAQQFGTLKDSRDGKVYKTVKIGEQEWMAENLHAFSFRNGDPILIAKSEKDWIDAYNMKLPACSYYENQLNNGKSYGVLYNYFAVIDKRGIAPEGWHVSTIDDIHNLVSIYGDYFTASENLRSDTGWNQHEGIIVCNYCKNWTNEQKAGITCKECKDTRNVRGFISYSGKNTLGFNALPGGYRGKNKFERIRELSAFWLINDENFIAISAFGREVEEKDLVKKKSYLSMEQSELERNMYGFSIRCVLGSLPSKFETGIQFSNKKNIIPLTPDTAHVPAAPTIKYRKFIGVDNANNPWNYPSPKEGGYIPLGLFGAQQVFSVSMWIKPSKIQNGVSIILDAEHGGAYNWVIQSLNSGSTWSWGKGEFNLKPNDWQHLLMTYNQGKRNIFINGKLIKSWNENINYRGQPNLVLGNWFEGARMFKGYIDELYISTDIQHSSEFIPQKQVIKPSKNTFGLWHFDEGSGNTTKESTKGINYSLGSWFWIWEELK
jgi:uncharacterized protein (TIGR02145 family)